MRDFRPPPIDFFLFGYWMSIHEAMRGREKGGAGVDVDEWLARTLTVFGEFTIQKAWDTSFVALNWKAARGYAVIIFWGFQMYLPYVRNKYILEANLRADSTGRELTLSKES